MVATRVLLLYQDSLLSQGIVSLLREHAEVHFEARRLADGGLLQFIEEFQPEVIIVDREELARNTPVTIDQLLREQRQIRIIDISANDDLARVYEGHQVRVARFEDLLATLGADARRTRRG